MVFFDFLGFFFFLLKEVIFFVLSTPYFWLTLLALIAVTTILVKWRHSKTSGDTNEKERTEKDKIPGHA
ncbi:hypothetical protein F9B85_13610 [Heliorestis acidaminivorans]|uniref:Uncharacterized protein n=1 Tax=Heliorestis acidaminivorans TaxID=553427 RepID=A0A6I0EU02_9FIRM|nr:hypothetical protein [Heliorestis acidaminivorans]KAB2950988.1 hypothetical protein F9B85_13610 [Heliorestis acidaminivorans]